MASSDSHDLLQDRVVAAIGDRYEIEGELGRGGMAVVYRARDVRLRRPVALKVLPPDLAFREGVRARFLREAETAAQLSHPNIVSIYAADETAGVAWLAMALVEGETLGARMSNGAPLTIPETRRILAEVSEALGYAHARGVVHRDIKPDNILLDRETGRALVTDFGIARAAEADQRLTVTGVAVGTPTYMSPEQALGEHDLDGRSDLYSLGVVGYQMLIGTPPFTATSAAALLMKHVGERPRPLGEMRRDLPPALSTAIDRVLSKKPAQRYVDAAGFRAALLSDAPPTGAIVVPAPPNGGLRAVDTPPMSYPAPQPTAPMPAANPEDAKDWRAELRERRREWRERDRDQREMQRDARRDFEREFKDAVREGTWRPGYSQPAPLVPSSQPLGGMPSAMGNAPAPWQQPMSPYNAFPLEERAERFRGKAIGSMALMVFLLFINLASMRGMHIPFPWALFPMMAISGRLRRRWRRDLAREGLSFSTLMLEGPDRAVEDARAQVGSGLSRIESNVRSLRRRVTIAVVAAILSCISFVIGGALSADPMIIPFVGFMVIAIIALQGSIVSALRVRRAKIPLGAALSSRWQASVQAADPRPRDMVLADEASRLVGESVLAGPYGRIVRGALDDRVAVRETLAKLSPADRALLPDIPPTIDSLVDRVAELAQSLHRLEHDVSPDQLTSLEARLRAAEAEPASAPDRARKVQLLQRQRASLIELAEKRATLAAQLESAQLVLQNIRLDLVKLRSKGVGAALGEVSTATQEARALSRDIKYALDAAAEVRGL